MIAKPEEDFLQECFEQANHRRTETRAVDFVDQLIAPGKMFNIPFLKLRTLAARIRTSLGTIC